MRSVVCTLLALLALSSCARPTEAELEARYGDARVIEELDASASDVMASTRHDASVAGLDAQIDAAPPQLREDAQVDASQVVVVDANMPAPVEDAGGPLTCDISPCQGHCPFGNVCCSPILTCGCQLSPEQPCVLPPIGTN